MSFKTSRSPIQLISLLQVLLVCLSIATATTIVGTAAHIYHTFVSQQTTNPWWLPLWPQHFDTSSLKASIGTAAAIVFLNVVFLVLIFVAKSKFSGLGKFSIFAAIGVSISSILLAISSIVLTNQLDHHLSTTETLKSWVCKWSNTTTSQTVSSDMSNNHFDTLCKESNFDFYGNVAVLSLQTLLFGTAVAQFMMSKKTPTKDDNSQHSLEKSSFSI